MTMMQYAIARRCAQLRAKEKGHPLSEKETKELAQLETIIQRYEAKETRAA